MKPIWVCTTAIAAALVLSACKGETKNLGIIPPDQRTAPLTPGTRDRLIHDGAQCTPASTGPAICTTTVPDCSLTFDSNDLLTHLRCSIDGLVFECTRPCPDVFECTWSDDHVCADLYDATGTFLQRACGPALDARLRCGDTTDGGTARDAGGSVCRGLDERTCAATPTCTPVSCGCNPPNYIGCFGPGDPQPDCPTCASCQGLDERTCMANAQCSPGYCPTCSGGQSYAGCFDPNTPHDCAPPPPNCHSCAGLDERACAADPACRADYCDECGTRTFVGCADPNARSTPCPAITCPNCMGLDEQSCSASAACHPVFVDPQACACAPVGCCTRFDHCGQGAHAECSLPGGPICAMAPPVCEGDYVIAYSNGCYDGCVHGNECGGQPNFCGANGVWPRFSRACRIDADCVAGIHQSDCCGTMAALGISSSEQATFRQDEAICEPEYPGCGCASRGIVAEDGQTAFDTANVHVRCDTTAQAGQCTTYVQ